MLGKLKKIAKNALAVPQVRRAYETTQRGVLGVVGGNRVAATAYSVPAMATFNREQYAVLAGRRRYYTSLGSGSRRTHVELRRNIHRLEKGILMEPRRAVFARDYVEETVEFYATAVRQPADVERIDAAELAWAHEVLDEYFSIVDRSDEGVERARALFESLPVPEPVQDGSVRRPYRHDQITRSDLTYEQLLALSKQRRSVRWFEDRPVPRDLIDKALVVGRESPTACNRLPYEYLVFDERASVEKVASIPFGAGGYHHQIPTVVVVKANLDSYFSPRDRHAPYVDASLATMGFIYALETLGLASSVINWPDFEPLELKMAKTLGLQPYERVVCLVAVGYPRADGMVASSQKKSLEVLRHFEPPLR
jgi:nitroreductase